MPHILNEKLSTLNLGFNVDQNIFPTAYYTYNPNNAYEVGSASWKIKDTLPSSITDYIYNFPCSEASISYNNALTQQYPGSLYDYRFTPLTARGVYSDESYCGNVINLFEMGEIIYFGNYDLAYQTLNKLLPALLAATGTSNYQLFLKTLLDPSKYQRLEDANKKLCFIWFNFPEGFRQQGNVEEGYIIVDTDIENEALSAYELEVVTAVQEYLSSSNAATTEETIDYKALDIANCTYCEDENNVKYIKISDNTVIFNNSDSTASHYSVSVLADGSETTLPLSSIVLNTIYEKVFCESLGLTNNGIVGLSVKNALGTYTINDHTYTGVTEDGIYVNERILLLIENQFSSASDIDIKFSHAAGSAALGGQIFPGTVFAVEPLSYKPKIVNNGAFVNPFRVIKIRNKNCLKTFFYHTIDLKAGLVYTFDIQNRDSFNFSYVNENDFSQIFEGQTSIEKMLASRGMLETIDPMSLKEFEGHGNEVFSLLNQTMVSGNIIESTGYPCKLWIWQVVENKYVDRLDAPSLVGSYTISLANDGDLIVQRVKWLDRTPWTIDLPANIKTDAKEGDGNIIIGNYGYISTTHGTYENPHLDTTNYNDGGESIITNYIVGSVTNPINNYLYLTFKEPNPLDIDDIIDSLIRDSASFGQEITTAVPTAGNYLYAFVVGTAGVTTLNFDYKYTATRPPCVIGDTLITLIDNTTKRIDSLDTEDLLLDEDKKATNITRIVKREVAVNRLGEYKFDDGTVIYTTGPHRFYNVEKDFFEMLHLWDLGDHTIKIDGTRPALISKHEIGIEEPEYGWGVETQSLTYWANGLLSAATAANERILKTASIKKAIEMAKSMQLQQKLEEVL